MKRIDVEKQLNLSFEQRRQHILKYSIFCLLSAESIHQLTLLMEEIKVQPNDVIVHEGDCYDGFYLIVSGYASVSRSLKRIKKTQPRHIITLGPDNAIGLGESGFPSQHGVRTATVTAQSSMTLLRMDLFRFYLFLKKHNDLYPCLKNMSEKFLLLSVIRQAQRANCLPVNTLKALSEKLNNSSPAVTIEEQLFPKNIYLFLKNNMTLSPGHKKLQSDISYLEQMIFRQINDKSTKENDFKNELNTEEIYLIMLQLKKLGFMDFDLVLNHASSPPILRQLIKKIFYYWKGKSIGEKK